MARFVSDTQFRKSSYSQPNNNNCVEAADLPGFSAVRDTQNRSAGHLEFGHAEWAALLSAVRTDHL